MHSTLCIEWQKQCFPQPRLCSQAQASSMSSSGGLRRRVWPQAFGLCLTSQLGYDGEGLRWGSTCNALQRDGDCCVESQSIPWGRLGRITPCQASAFCVFPSRHFGAKVAAFNSCQPSRSKRILESWPHIDCLLLFWCLVASSPRSFQSGGAGFDLNCQVSLVDSDGP